VNGIYERDIPNIDAVSRIDIISFKESVFLPALPGVCLEGISPPATANPRIIRDFTPMRRRIPVT
jgi:hypothetical protein